MYKHFLNKLRTVHMCNWHIKKNYEERVGDKVECKLFLTVKPFFKTVSRTREICANTNAELK